MRDDDDAIVEEELLSLRGEFRVAIRSVCWAGLKGDLPGDCFKFYKKYKNDIECQQGTGKPNILATAIQSINENSPSIKIAVGMDPGLMGFYSGSPQTQIHHFRVEELVQQQGLRFLGLC